MKWPLMLAACILFGAGIVVVGATSFEPRRLKIEVSHIASTEAGVPVATISGAILNTGDKTVPVPNVRIAFRNQQGVDILVRETVPSRRSLGPGDHATFSVRVEHPPADAADVEVYLVGARPTFLERLFW